VSLARIRQNRRVDTVEQITDRQLEVARLIAEGRSNPEIADALGVSLAGAKYHVSELLGRLGVTSREDVAAWYRHREGVPARRGWRERARMLVPAGAILSAVAGAAIVSVALSGGRDDSGLPVSAVTETATAVPTEPVSRTAGEDDTPSAVVNYCWTGVWEPGIWPAREGMLQPTYFPDGWRVYQMQGGPIDWQDPDSDCSFTDLQIVLAPMDTSPMDTPPIETGGTVDDWIAFTQTPLGGPAPDLTTDQPVTLSDDRVAFRSTEDGIERLAWEQDGFIALLASPGVRFTELIWIAESTMLATTSPKLPLFFEYEIQPTDSLASVARSFGVSEETLIWNNVDMDALLAEGSPNSFVRILPPGTRIRVPTVDGILHVAQPGETVASIAATYHAEERDILEFAANGLDGDPARLEAGTLILVPGGTKEFPPPP